MQKTLFSIFMIKLIVTGCSSSNVLILNVKQVEKYHLEKFSKFHNEMFKRGVDPSLI